MNPRNTGILLLVAAALGAFIYFYEIQGAQSRRDAEEREKRLFAGVEPSAIEWIALAPPGGTPSRVERREGTWRMLEPVDFPADSSGVDSLASTLATLGSESVLEGPGPPEEYGLGDGARVVRFSAGGKEHELRLGKDSPVGQNTYASTGSGAIYTIARYKAASFDKKPDDLRDKRVLDFDRESIEHIEASWPGGRVVLEREPKPAEPGEKQADAEKAAPPARRGWRLVEPIAARADGEAVDEMLSDLSLLRAEGFVDDPPPDAAAGLAPPAFEIALQAPAQGEGAQPRVFRLAIGAKHGDDLRLARGAQQSLYTIAASRYEALPRDVMAYRWKQLAHFDLADAHAADFFYQAPTGDPVVIHAERGDGGWTSTPDSFAAGKLDTAIAALSHLKATQIVADSMEEPKLRKLGLAPPNAVVTVFGKRPEGEKTAEGESALPVLGEVQFGNVEGSEWIAARAAGDPTVYRLAYSLAEQLPVSLDAFRNRFRAEEPPARPAQEAKPEPDEGEDFPPAGQESP
jgi:hypothetical protein